jgi:hypothetical protein
MPAGKYYIGDLCYVMTDEEWKEFCAITIQGNKCVDGEFEFGDGRRFATYGTAWGDGEYYDQYGHTYSVDAGLIGCVLTSDIRAHKYDNLLDLGAVLEFAETFETGSHKGQLVFGHVLIDTDPEPNWGG